MNLLDEPIGQIACAIPGATRIFHEHKLDFCCGGHKSLREAAQKRGVDEVRLASTLEALRSEVGQERDWRNASPDELIEFILTRFHERHRAELPELIRLAYRVEEVHSARAECPRGLALLLETMHQDLLSHMMKEEQILFPTILREAYGQAVAPISVMRFEHDHHGETLADLAGMTNDLTPPDDACNTWRALYAGLRALREDLMQHIHLENNVLFLKAEALAR